MPDPSRYDGRHPEPPYPTADDAISELAALKARIAEIADDFHPDTDREASQALQEMRDALLAAVS